MENEAERLVALMNRLVSNAPTRLDRACRAYALNAALNADDDWTEFKKFTAFLQKQADADHLARGIVVVKPGG